MYLCWKCQRSTLPLENLFFLLCVYTGELTAALRFSVTAKCADGFIGEASVAPCTDNMQEYRL